ncbi:SAM-dependent methyltransferase [Streptacidiphilus monticola]
MSESESVWESTGVPGADWSWTRGVDEADHHVDLRTDIPHPARMYDYYLGGKDHFPADRAAAEAAIAAYPPLRELARANRAFLGRAVRYAHARGLDQFLDVGTGIPTAGSTGEVLSGLGSPASVVYVDNDPIVLSHSRALLTRRPGGRTTVVQADLREPKAILESPEVQQALDLSRPVALLLVAVLHFVPDQDGAQEAVRDLREALAPGSLLVLSHGSADFSTPPPPTAARRPTGTPVHRWCCDRAPRSPASSATSPWPTRAWSNSPLAPRRGPGPRLAVALRLCRRRG